MALTDDVRSNASKNPLFSPHPNVSKSLDQAADEAAEKAGQTENEFDQDHDIFTKSYGHSCPPAQQAIGMICGV
jgi:hypothetical protein